MSADRRCDLTRLIDTDVPVELRRMLKVSISAAIDEAIENERAACLAIADSQRPDVDLDKCDEYHRGQYRCASDVALMIRRRGAR